MLIIQNSFTVTCQVDTRDTLYVKDSDFNDIINYSARDSIYTDVKNKLVFLYGGAEVNMGEILLTAGFIEIDLNKNELSAKYILDSVGEPMEYPVFKDGQQEMVCQEMRYNLKTKKGFIQELNLKQDEFYFQMETAKKHSNYEIHLLKCKLTTCDQKEPHYHFQLSKGVIVPEERIATGPMNLWINGIPTHLGLPFALIPNQKERTHGLLFPELVPISAYGFGFQNLGYYFPINESFQNQELRVLINGEIQNINSDEYFANKKIILVGVPGAFTTTCHLSHLPGYIENLQNFKNKDYSVVFIAVNDPFVIKTWSEVSNADGIDMLADGNCDLTNELGLTMDGSGFCLGNRCKRFAMMVDNGVVQSLDIEEAGALDVSSAESQLAKI